MALSIKLSLPDSPIYSSGDTISGVVKLHTTESNEPCESLSVVFLGRTTVSLTRHDADMVTDHKPRYLSQGFLFMRSLLLESRTDVQGPGTSYWPFSFVVPRHADFGLGYDVASRGDMFECESPWKGAIDADAHSLPPSMRYESAFRCSVSYDLIARLIRRPGTNLQNRHDLNVTHPIQISHCHHHLNHGTDHHQFLTQSIQSNLPLSHSGMADRIGLCARKMGRLTGWSSSTHPVSHDGKLRLRLHLPSVIMHRDQCPVPIGVSITYSGPDPIDDDEQVSVTNFTVELVATTNVRAGMRRQDQKTVVSLYKGSFNRTLKYSTSENPTDSDDGANDLDVNMGTLLRSAFQKHDPVPEFATYNIHRAYHLRVRLDLRAFGQAMYFRKDGIAIEIPGACKAETETGVPPYSAATSHSTASEDPGGIHRSPTDECISQPPAYSPRVAAVVV